MGEVGVRGLGGAEDRTCKCIVVMLRGVVKSVAADAKPDTLG